MEKQQELNLTAEQSFAIASMISSTKTKAAQSSNPEKIWEEALRKTLEFLYNSKNTYEKMIGQNWGILP